jgi:uncharacterized membrane protein
MFRSISKTLLTGLITLLPIGLTAYLLYWLVTSTEAALGSVIRLILPESLYWPGMGTIAGVLVVFAVGVLMHAYVVQRLFAWAEHVLYHLPVIRTVYRSIRDFLDYFSPGRKAEFQQVVAVSIGETGMQMIGFVTQAETDRLPKDYRAQDSVLVYVPMSYMIGGYAVLMPRSAIRPLDMSLEEAMRFTLTAGVTGAR